MAAVRGYDFESQMSSRGDFRKHPASWLNGECWNDDCVAEAVASPHVGSDIAPLTPTSEARFIEARRLWAHQGCNGPVPKRSDFAEERAA